MSDETNNPDTPIPGPGVVDWLKNIIGAPRTSLASARPPMPAGFFATSDDNGQSVEDASGPMMVSIPLDVSVEIDDPALLKSMQVIFSGLPENAALSTGTSTSENVWTVAAADLGDLHIDVVEGTADFDLQIVLEDADGENQSTVIRVETSTDDGSQDTESIEDETEFFTIKFLPPENLLKSRINIFVDGNIALDQVIEWSGDADTIHDLSIPRTFEGIPYEILIRLRSHDDDDTMLPGFVGLTFDEKFISANAPAITGQGDWNGECLRWTGDILIDLPGALAEDLLTPPEPVAAATTYDPSATDQQRAANVVDEATLDDTDNTGDSDVLVIRVGMDDVKRPAFISELRHLRDFIQTRPDSSDTDRYERLGLDVRNWSDMKAVGPTGMPVELDPAFPDLAPSGGIDNTRAPKPLRVSEGLRTSGQNIKVTGLPPGSLLTHGRNLGEGVWILSVDEFEDAAVLPAMADRTTNAIQIARTDETKGSEELCGTVLIGPGELFSESGNEMPVLRLFLEPEIFDPDGHSALSLTIGDLPAGCILDAGKNHGDGVWTVESESGAALGVSVLRSAPKFAMNMTCVALNSDTGESTVVSRRISVNPRRARISVISG